MFPEIFINTRIILFILLCNYLINQIAFYVLSIIFFYSFDNFSSLIDTINK